MGKKTRREREERRDSYASQRVRQKRKNALIAIGVISAVGILIAFSAWNLVTNQNSAPGTPPGAGPLRGEHEHASVLVKIFGDTFDFSAPSYQTQNSWIHFEAQDGATIHRHAAGVTMGYLFETLGITIDEECYVFPDERRFCTNDEFSLKYLLNSEQVPDIREHVLEDGDRILITYGNESQEEIDAYLDEVGSQIILS